MIILSILCGGMGFAASMLIRLHKINKELSTKLDIIDQGLSLIFSTDIHGHEFNNNLLRFLLAAAQMQMSAWRDDATKAENYERAAELNEGIKAINEVINQKIYPEQ